MPLLERALHIVMGGKLLTAILILMVCFAVPSHSRHLFVARQLDPDTTFQYNEKRFTNNRFSPREDDEFLARMGDNLDPRQPDIGFAEVTPDVLLERLIDEADEERRIEDFAQETFFKQPISRNGESMNSDLDETL